MKVVVDVSADLAEFLKQQECTPDAWSEEMRSVANDIACHVIQVVRDGQDG